jgi:hypothetical protein
LCCVFPTPNSQCGPAPLCGCLAGQNCIFDTTSNWSCVPAGSDALGQTCSTPNDCAPGLTCAEYGSNMQFTCHAYCSGDGTVRCASGTCGQLSNANTMTPEPGGYACF